MGEPGPPVVIFGTLERWKPRTMRTMLTRFFLPVQILALTNFNSAGLITPAVLTQLTAAIPGVLLATAVGTYINRRIDPSAFTNAVYAVVVALGFLSIGSAF